MNLEKSSDTNCGEANQYSGELSKPRYYEKLLSILCAGCDVSLTLEAYKNFDKDLLTSIHNKGRLNLTHPQIQKVFLMHDVPEEENKETYEILESLDELVPVKIKDLEIGKRNECCAIYGVLCVLPFKFGRIYTLLEEVDTGNAVVLSIVSSDPSSIHQGFAREKFPQGMKIAVKEPLLVAGEGGIIFINVDNPRCIEAAQTTHAPQIDQRKLDDWILSGNAAWQEKDWEKCRLFITKSLLSMSKTESEIPKEVSLLYSKRWSANIMLGRYAEALEDAEWICQNRPSESSVTQYKIQSLLSVGRYKDAFRFFQSSCASHKEKEAAFTRTYRKWSLKYAYNHDFVPDGDFVGPVEIRMTSNGSGRGLFATENVEMGETFLLSRPLAVAQTALQNPIENGLLQKVKNELILNGKETLRIFLSHVSSKCVPNMLDFFQIKSQKTSGKLCKMVADKDDEIDRVTERIALDDRSVEMIADDKNDWEMWNFVEDRLYYGVWLLPSFINHSCVPNAARKINKGIISFHATKPIEKGEEITVPYFRVLLPFPYRRKYCQAFGFDCICKRCELEKRYLDFESKGCKSKVMYESYSNALESKIEDRAVLLEKLVNQVEKYLKILRQRHIEVDEDGEAWIRSSFMAAYLAQIYCRRKNAVKLLSDREETILVTAARAINKTSPGDVYNLIFCQFLYNMYARFYPALHSSLPPARFVNLIRYHVSSYSVLRDAVLCVFAQKISYSTGPDGAYILQGLTDHTSKIYEAIGKF